MSQYPDLRLARSALLAQFKCQQSGACCESDGYVYVTDQDIERMASHLKMTITAFCEQFVRADGAWKVIASPTFRRRCFLDSHNRCQVYEYRPKYCREYPTCPEIWRTEADAHAELAKCQGLRLAYEAVFNEPYRFPTDAAIPG